MSNVLPPEAIKKMRRANAARLVLIGSLFAVCSACVALLSLLPTYALIATPAAVEVQGDALSVSEKEERDEIARARLMIRELMPLAVSTTTRSGIDIVSSIIDARPNGIFLRSINLELGEEAKIIIAGTAASRELINTFRISLMKDAAFTNVAVPLQNLTSMQGEFTLTITGTF
jgi:hypothetical protein